MNPNPLLALNHFTVPCSLTDVLTFLLSYLCFSTASSRTTKKAASVNLQPLQSNLKVLQEQQTQPKHSMFSAPGLVNCSRAKIMDDGDKINWPRVPSGTSKTDCRKTVTAGASGRAHRCSQKESPLHQQIVCTPVQTRGRLRIHSRPRSAASLRSSSASEQPAEPRFRKGLEHKRQTPFCDFGTIRSS
jgi:hypothetical protein